MVARFERLEQAPVNHILHLTNLMPQNLQAGAGKETVRKAAASDLKIGLICADRDGNRIRIDHIDPSTGSLSYHFLNDELRVQEGIQESSIQSFLNEGWYVGVTARL